MLHPIVRLVVWGAAIVLVQYLSFLGLLLACTVAMAVAVRLAPERLRQLLKRTRWLILALVMLFALATPGVYLLPQLGSLGPTREGLSLGFEHLMRLLFVLSSLAVLLQVTGMDGLVAGLHGLIRPLSFLGLDRGRVALRLLLVLNYVEQAPPDRHWREWLEDAGGKLPIGEVCLRKARFAPLDYAVLAGLTFIISLFIGFAS